MKSEAEEKWKLVLKLAREVGQMVADSRHVLLTGGGPVKGSNKVHENAMWSASENRGLAIGVLPAGDPFNPEPGIVEVKPEGRTLLVRTKLTSWERDFINGTTPDVLIALEGGSGTLAEVLIAKAQHHDVIFLKSRATLQNVGKTKRYQDKTKKILIAAFKKARGEDPKGSKLAAALDGIAAPLDGTDCDSALDAVEAATAAVCRQPGKTGYPDMDCAPKKRDFEHEFHEFVLLHSRPS